MRPRGCLISIAALAGLVLLCCVVGFFVGIPRLRDSIRDSISDELSTQVAAQLDLEVTPGAGDTYTISVADLQREIDANMESDSTSDFKISVDPNGIAVSFTSGSQTFGYKGTPTVRDGKLVIDDMTVDNGALGWLMPADKLADSIENGINDYFAARGQAIQDVQLGNNEITVTTVPSGG